jgi:hypothetical protein
MGVKTGKSAHMAVVAVCPYCENWMIIEDGAPMTGDRVSCDNDSCGKAFLLPSITP